ncbi:MAG TPA: hypothetical protein PKA63_02520 [Oligoflexia bacterium]|nr:hypothetical protein [Oligoflexia bacterium]HMP47526.1 hypothetical protein [Oligoflexia bacterium]
MTDNEIKKLSARAKELVMEYSKIPVISSILDRLGSELPADLYYHNLLHTLEVMEDSIFFALYDNLEDDQIKLLAIAAAYHDSGYIYQRDNNETIAAELAKKELEKDGNFSKEEIQTIATMIEDTTVLIVDHQFTRLVSCDLSRYLLDADMANLGSSDFFEKNRLIQKETGMEEDKFYQLSLSLLKSHRWLSPAAEALQEEQRLKNLKILENSETNKQNT